MRFYTECLLFLLLLMGYTMPVFAQEEPDSLGGLEPALNVYLDCDRCDDDYIRQELRFINYVRDRQDADVHLLITRQGTGSGGTEYTLNFIGQGDFVEINTVLVHATAGTDTDEERRRGLVRVITMGLVPFLSQTDFGEQVNVTVGLIPDLNRVPQADKWKNWVFRIGMDGEADGEESQRSYQLGGRFSASRVTEDWKVSLGVNGDYEEQHYETSEGKITSTFRSGEFEGLIARSLGRHGAVGVFANASTSSFENTNLSMELSPAVEYNLFPYSESTRREFTFTYRLNLRSFRYDETTIFGETAETRLQQSLRASFETRQPWGNADLTLGFSHYLHDFGKNRFDVFLRFEIQIVRGLSFDIFGRYSRLHDQLFLAAEDPTDEEILLNQRQLATSYEYNVSVGFSYRFGSIFNNIVNSRF